jgi:hypothetical protein
MTLYTADEVLHMPGAGARSVRRLRRRRHRDRHHGGMLGAGVGWGRRGTANRAGGIVVGKLGTATVTRDELFPQ